MRQVLLYATACILMALAAGSDALAQPSPPVPPQPDLTNVYGTDELANRDLTYRDARFLVMRDTDTRYQMPVYPTQEAWERRADFLRAQVLVAAGLWPMPEKTPLNANISGRIERDDYTIEKVYFESHRGFFVAGNLYRPKGRTGPFPAILTPHGHWQVGRITHNDVGSIPARSINFAKQGYVVLAYDMVGYGDTRQINHSFAADSLSQLWGINLLGLQLWNSIRALDLLRSLPDVDTTRIGVTGASGGGTQTFLLSAIDTAGVIKVTAPVNMISTVMQGGCLCENAPGLRLNTFNVELGALSAPRPMLMVSNTQDWTLHTPLVEYPMTQSIYGLYDAEDRLANTHFDYPHNYNKASREAVYAWFARWLLGDEDASKYREQPFVVEKDEDLLIFLKTSNPNRDLTFADMPSAQFTPPPGDMDAAKLSAYLQQQAARQVREAWPEDRAGSEAFEQRYGTAMMHVLAAEVPGDVTAVRRGEISRTGYTAGKWLISRTGQRDWIPAVWYRPGAESRTATVVVAPEGKAALVTTNGELAELIGELLASGQGVLAIDAFGTGEHVLPDETETPRDEQFKFFTTFNRTDTQESVQDILTAISFLKQQGVESVNLVGTGDAGIWALLAAGIAREALDHVVIQQTRLNTDDPSDALRYFVPGLLRAGGLQTAAALTAPVPLLLVETGPVFDAQAVSQAYEAAQGAGRFRFTMEPMTSREIIQWMSD